MGKSFEIQHASYGILGKKDIDITSFILQNRYRVSKTINLQEEFGDPYPNQQKFVDVHFRVAEEKTELYEEEEFKIKNGGCRIGFEQYIPFSIEIPNLYRYKILQAKFQIHNMVVRPAHYANPNEFIVVEPSQWDAIVSRTDDGYYKVNEHINIVEWMGSDPFPFRQKIIELSYSREAIYSIRVYEHGGFLLKDLVLLVELPLYRLNMLYHLYPKFHHHLAGIHRRYLAMASNIFSKIIVSVADEVDGDQLRNEDMTKEMFAYAPDLEMLHTCSDAIRKDSNSFLHLLEASSRSKSDYILYCHSKGFAEYQMHILPNVACWVELSYIELFSNIDVVIEQDANFGGCFMHTVTNEGKLMDWRFPGNFYWMKSSIVHHFVRSGLLNPTQQNENDLPKEFPKKMCRELNGCINLLPCKEGMHDMYNHQCILQFKTLIETCTKDGMSRRAIGLL